MKGKIFLFGETKDSLIPMEETPYHRESVLQDWLSNYPELLPGDQINPEDPRRWLLVKAEMGVPGCENGPDRWSLDHLFLDQEGIPTFVECKRSVDTRARREVVSQMLDYAANGLQYWSMERIRQLAAEVSESPLDKRVSELIISDDQEAIEDYWKTVESNLREGKVRLLFVADETTSELRRLVEFLNEKLKDIEVLIVEVRQFSGESHTAVVPRVIGVTEAGRKNRATRPSRGTPWTEEEFLRTVGMSDNPGNSAPIRSILNILKGRGFQVKGGRGQVVASLDLVISTETGMVRPFRFECAGSWTRLYVYFSGIRPIREDPVKRQELIEKLLNLGSSMSDNPQYPSIDCTVLRDADKWDDFQKMIEWILEEGI